MIDFPVVDSHVHLIDPDRFSYGWMADAPSLRRHTRPKDLNEAAAPCRIGRFVFVEVDVDRPQHLDEAAFVAELADSEPQIAGLVASLPLERGKAIEAELEQLSGNRLLRGIRRLIQSEPDPDFCIRPNFIDGLRLLAGRDLSFDICIYHNQFPAALEMVRQCPDTRFVLDHIGKPGIKAGLLDPWREHMRTLAGFDNVCCKISGVVTEADHAAWTPDQVKPYVEHALDCFGFDRCMFGGDWPVLELAGRYPQWIEIVDEVTAGASADERRQLFCDTAIGFYRL